MLSGILIVGGSAYKERNYSEWNDLNSAEIFNPMTRRTCSVGNLKQARHMHTICNNMVCGGSEREALTSCEKFDGISSFTSLPVRLVKARYDHLCWGLESGDVLLLGGHHSPTTTERVSADGSSSALDFKLPYKTR